MSLPLLFHVALSVCGGTRRAIQAHTANHANRSRAMASAGASACRQGISVPASLRPTHVRPGINLMKNAATLLMILRGAWRTFKMLTVPPPRFDLRPRSLRSENQRVNQSLKYTHVPKECLKSKTMRNKQIRPKEADASAPERRNRKLTKGFAGRPESGTAGPAPSAK
jgi:hypothetical protein